MDESDRQRLLASLLDLKEKLQIETESLAESSKPVTLDQTRVGRLSRMDAIQSQQLALAATRRCAQQLREVHAALDRIYSEPDLFAVCNYCGEYINIRRLFANPTLQTCVECAEKLSDHS